MATPCFASEFAEQIVATVQQTEPHTPGLPGRGGTLKTLRLWVGDKLQRVVSRSPRHTLLRAGGLSWKKCQKLLGQRNPHKRAAVLERFLGRDERVMRRDVGRIQTLPGSKGSFFVSHVLVYSPSHNGRESRMATWFRPTLSTAEQDAVLADRNHHPDPIVRRKLNVLWAVHLGHSRDEAARIAHVGVATAKRYILAYRDGGLEALRRRDPGPRPTSQLADHADRIQRSLTERPVRTTAEAIVRIHELTGIRRGLTQTRRPPRCNGSGERSATLTHSVPLATSAQIPDNINRIPE